MMSGKKRRESQGPSARLARSCRKRGGCYCALSPCRRGRRLHVRKFGWVRGANLNRSTSTPHPLEQVATTWSPLPQGERARAAAHRLGETLLQRVCGLLGDLGRGLVHVSHELLQGIASNR